VAKKKSKKKSKKGKKGKKGRKSNKGSTKRKKKQETEDDDDDGEVEEHGKSGAVTFDDIDDWDDTEEAPSFSEVPDDKYEAKIASATLNRSKSSGRRQCSWDLIIISGEMKGRHVFKHDGLEDEQQRSYFRQALAKLGIAWPKKSELAETLSELEGTFAAITVRTKGEFQNVYFDRALDSDDVGDIDDLDDDGDGDGDDAAELEKGDRVTAEIDGETYAGKIMKIKGSKATVKFDDGDKQTLPLDELSAEDTDDDGDGDDDGDDDGDGDGDDDAPELEKGSRVTAEIDGETYAGEIKKVKGKKATVEFDDGDTQKIALDDLTAEDDDGDGDDDDGDGDDDGDDGDGEGVEVEFDDDDLTSKDKKKIKKLAKKYKMDPEDYDTTSDLLVEIAEYCDISGTYKKASKLIKECEEHEDDE